MNRSLPAMVAALTGTLILILTGCATGVAAFPDVAPAGSQVPLGTIQGSDYGGHAPIVGAHVFVLQVGTGGYGSKVTSLLSAGETTTDYYGSVYTTAQDNVSGSPTNGMYYITTDSRGDFALSGDYTCTAGLPVYVYASGGNPSTSPAVTITQINSYTDSNNKTVVVFTTSGTNLLYQGEQVNFSTFTTGTAYDSFSGATNEPVSPFYLTTTTFGVELGANLTSYLPQGVAVNAIVTQASNFSNPAIANIALLGNCPGSITFAGIPDGTSTNTLSGVSPADLAKLAVGNVVLGPGIYNATITGINSSTGTITFNQADTGGNPAGPFYSYASSSTAAQNFSYLNFLYMNEVSTVAAMEALAPFASTTANNDALHIGTSSTNLAGLQNAVLNAANLYDIQGSQVGTGGDGDTHIAYATSPRNSNGTVPQQLLNTLGNLLANCVDSANTYNAATAPSGTQSTQCAALMSNATSDGTTTGTQPNDTATAMLNIAHYPAGEPSGNTTFVSGLFNSITGNAPFQPMLSSAPNDFSVGISYTGGGLSAPSGVAIDYSGDAWITSTGAVVELGPSGTAISGSAGYATVSGQLSRSPAIDLGGNVWFTQNLSTVWKMNSSGVVQSGSGYGTGNTLCPEPPEPLALAVDGNNNVWVTNYYGDYQGESIVELSPGGALLQSVNTFTNTGCPIYGSGPATVRNLYGIAMDGNGVMWSPGYSSENVAAVNTSTTTGAYTAYDDSNSGTVPAGPQYPAVDQNGKIWLPNYYLGATAGAGNYIDVFAPSTAVASGTANADNVAMTSYTGGGLGNGVNAIAVDGANNIWAMGGNAYVSEFTNSGTALTPSTGYAGGFTGTGARLAIDGSGSVWLPEASTNAVVQMIGVATPVMTPLVAAAKAGTPAAKP